MIARSIGSQVSSEECGDEYLYDIFIYITRIGGHGCQQGL